MECLSYIFFTWMFFSCYPVRIFMIISYSLLELWFILTFKTSQPWKYLWFLCNGAFSTFYCSTKSFKERWVSEEKHARGKWNKSSDLTHFQTAFAFVVGWPWTAAKHPPNLLLTLVSRNGKKIEGRQKEKSIKSVWAK